VLAAMYLVAQKAINTGKDQSSPIWWVFVGICVVGVIAGFARHAGRGRGGS